MCGCKCVRQVDDVLPFVDAMRGFVELAGLNVVLGCFAVVLGRCCGSDKVVVMDRVGEEIVVNRSD